MSKHKFDTICLHGGQSLDSDTGSRAVPIHQTTSYVFRDAQHADNLFHLKELGNIYTRIMNPTTAVLETRVAQLEGGSGGLALASGQSAEQVALFTILKQGDELLSSTYLYGGTHTLFSHILPRFGIKAHFFSTEDELPKLYNPRVKAIYCETIGNPGLNVPDFDRIVSFARDKKIPVIVDNTAATPYLCQPFAHGANISLHSLTKFLGGHGNSIGGVLVDGGNFDWGNGNFPEFTTPDTSYNNLVFWDVFKNFAPCDNNNVAYIFKARLSVLRPLGPCISPFNAFLILQGIETLHLRMRRHCDNAMKVAQYLKNHKQVGWVNYVGLPEHPSHANAKKYLRNRMAPGPTGFGAILGFGVKGGYDAAVKFINSVKLLSHLANIGDAKTLVLHPASTSHSQMAPADQKLAGVSPDFVRLSIGIEDVDDIIADIDQALQP